MFEGSLPHFRIVMWVAGLIGLHTGVVLGKRVELRGWYAGGAAAAGAAWGYRSGMRVRGMVARTRRLAQDLEVLFGGGTVFA